MESKSRIPAICIVGAGFSGICAGVQLQRKLGLNSFTIFDENLDFGGTWLVHTYPNCGCDIPSSLYSFSFEPNPKWSSVYPKQEEILGYLKSIAKKYDLYSRARFQEQIQSMHWEPLLHKWRVTSRNMRTEEEQEHLFDFVFAGPGTFRRANIPEILQGFDGPFFHSSKWDNSIFLEGRVVAVVGSGASAIQIIPGIVNKVAKLYSFQRRPAWMFPKLQVEIPQMIQRAFEHVPGLLKGVRDCVFWSFESSFLAFKNDSVANQFATKFAKWQLNRQVKDPELRRKLTPDYKVGCKRITPSNEYYPALCKPNVEVIRSGISKVKGHTITTEDGDEYTIDVLILATGYPILEKWFSPVEVWTEEGTNLMDIWRKDGPSHYLSIMSHLTPNLFFIIGPNGGVPYSSAVFAIEYVVNWALQVMKHMMRENLSAVMVKRSAEDEYMAGVVKDFEKTVYGGGGGSSGGSGGCNSWLTDEKGVATVNPGSLIGYWRKARRVNWKHLDFFTMERL